MIDEFVYTYRVGYADTDKMGYVHHSNYACIYEKARWEYFRQLGLTYTDLEAQGFMFPVIDLRSQFMKPAFYDNELQVKVIIHMMGAVRIGFRYTVQNENGQLINTGSTVLACVDAQKRTPCRIPDFVLEQLDETVNSL